MFIANKDLRNRAAIAARMHFLAQLLILFNIDFAENHLLLLQQAFGPLAVRAPVRDVNGD
jgi:hypothetical protein